MTVSSALASKEYAGNGSTVAFPIPFYFLANDHLIVELLNADGSVSPWSENSDYSLTGATDEMGGTLTAATAPPRGATLRIARNLAQVQLTEYPVNAKFPASSHERALDYLTMVDQQQQLALDDALSLRSNRNAFNGRGLPMADIGLGDGDSDASTVAQSRGYAEAAAAGVVGGYGWFKQTGVASVDRTFQDKQREIISSGDYGAVGDGSADDTAAIQAAIDTVNGFSTATFTLGTGSVINRPRGIVRLGFAKKYKVTNLVVPPGVILDLNQSMIIGSASGAVVHVQGSLTGYYSGMFSAVKNGVIDGGGVADKGLWIEVVNWSEYDNLVVQNCKLGVVLHEVQYTTFRNVRAYANQVGWYITARPANTALTSIDNAYYNCVSDYNTKYGIWLQCSSHSAWYRLDCSRNGVCDVLIGSQLVGYISAYTLTSGGAGYPASSVIPITFTGGAGTDAKAYVTTNASGVVIGITSIESGFGYTSTPVLSVAGGTTAAVLSCTVSDDTGLGDWDGVSSIIRGHNSIYDLKCEHARDDRPISGYAIWVNSSQMRGNSFLRPFCARQNTGTGNTSYYRWLRSDARGTEVVRPNDDGLASVIQNPMNTADISIFKTTASGGLFVDWGFYGASNMQALVIDGTGAVVNGGFAQHQGNDGVGRAQSAGFRAVQTSAPLYAGFVVQDSLSANPAWQVLQNGKMQWGDGTAAVDVEFSRSAANTLAMGAGDSFKTDGTWNGGHLILGAKHIWVDATGSLRIKGSAPTSDTDGVTVGSQT